MFAVIKTGGLQYRVVEDQVLKVGKIKGEPGEIVQLGEVMLLGGDTPQLGAPMVSGASVAVEVIQQGRGKKVIAFKKRRRKNSRRTARAPAGIHAHPHQRNSDRGQSAVEKGAAKARAEGKGCNARR